MRADGSQDRALIIAGTSLCLVAAAAAWFVYPGALNLPLALVSLLPPLAVACVRASRNGIVDPLAVFALSVAAYNGVLLVRMSYGISPHDTPFAIDGPLFFRAGILSGLGSLGLVLGWMLAKDGRQQVLIERTHSQCTSSFVTGIIFYGIGVTLYLIQYAQVGGYMESVAMDRGQRFEMLTHTVSMPYEGFVLSGLCLMFYGSIGLKDLRVTLSVAASFLWLGLVLLQGDRRLALQMILALAVMIGTLRPKLTRLRPLALVCIALVYSAAVIFGQYRTLIYDLAAGRSTLEQAQVLADNEESVMGKPEDSELGGPYISVLYYSRGTEPLRWGLSYISSLPAVVPKVLYPGRKTQAISADLDQALHEGVGPVYGWGFSPIAEGFANFGYVGPFIVMMLWSLLFAWIGNNRSRSLTGAVVCAILLQEAVNANRIDFRYVYFESVYCVGVGVVAVLVMRAISRVTDRASNLERPVSVSGQQVTALGNSPLRRNSNKIASSWN